MRRFLNDLRHAFGRLRRSPVASGVSILTLGLAIGVNAALFGIVDRVLLRALPFEAPDRLVSVHVGPAGASVDKRTLVELRTRLASVTDLAGYSGWNFTLTGSGEPERLQGTKATSALFRALGTAPLLGRGFDPEDERSGSPAQVLLSHDVWQSRFGGHPDVFGEALTLNGGPATVVGVMPDDFRFPAARSALWVSTPIDPADGEDYSAAYLLLVGRLAPGATREQAARELHTAVRALRQDRGAEAGGAPVETAVVPLRDELAGSARGALLLLFAAVGLVLLIACANLVSLLLAGIAARRREMAIRKALGATRGRLALLVFADSLAVAAPGGVLGLLLAIWTLPLITRLLPADFPDLGTMAIDLRGVLFIGAVSLAAGLLVGALPAIRAGRPRSVEALRAPQGALAAGSHRLQGMLVAGEVAAGIVLAASACLLFKSFDALRRIDPGFRSDGVTMVPLSLPGEETDTPADRARRAQAMSAVIDRLAALPGVDAVGGIHITPLSGNNWNPWLDIEGRPAAKGEDREVDWRVVTPGTFRALGVPLLDGRVFTPGDDGAAPGVAIVNRTLAQRFFSGSSPIGARVSTGFEGEGRWVTIVGVVGDTRDLRLEAPPRPQMYRPHAQFPLGGLTLVARAAGAAAPAGGTLRAAVREAAPGAVIADPQEIGRAVDEALRRPRLLLALFGCFALLALALGTVGVFGIMAHSVSLRIPEFGVRLALGARPRDVLLAVLRHAATLGGIGVVAGTAAGLVAARILQQFLYGVAARDAAVFAGVGLLLLVASLAAALPAAVRAARVSPLVAMRAD